MMAYNIKTNICVILLLILSVSCSEKYKIEYHGIFASGMESNPGLHNPDRGLRLEIAVDVVLDKEDPLKSLKEQVEIYKSDSVSLVQTYIYLTNVIGKDLTEENFAVMQLLFDEFEKLGMKSVLRFAYERDFNGRETVGPTLEQTLIHIEQLKPFLYKNKSLIHVLQAGIIGAWGEWHSSVHGLDQSEEAKISILKKLLEVVPKELTVQVRVPEYKNLLSNEPDLYKRLSFHDDMIIIKPHKWDGEMHEGTPFFDQIVKESKFLPMDGELPWGFWSINKDPDSPDAGWLIDGHQAARRFFLQHFTSLSAIHNYLELRGREGDEDEIDYSMQKWKKEFIDIDFLKKEDMPISNNYFETESGEYAKRTIFDYIRDHLGYRIELQSLELDKQWSIGKTHALNLKLINRGFATVFNKYDVYFVLLDNNGNVVMSKTDINVFDWQPNKENEDSIEILEHVVDHGFILSDNQKTGKYKLGLWIPSGNEELKYNAKYAIRCANEDTEWYTSPDGKYGINVLTTIDVE